MLSSLVISLPLGGCLLSGDRPEPGLDIPQGYARSSKNPKIAEAALPPLDWWRSFRSREMSDLIEQARESNLDIAAAIARVVQADAQSRITGAALLPTVDLNGNATRTRSSQSTAGGGLGIGGSESNNLQATLTASYEIDFWGKNRAAVRATEETAAASRFDREVVGLTTVVSTANTYLNLLAAQDRLRVARDNLAAAQRVLNLIQQRLNAGTASALEVSQQESLVATQRAVIPPLEQTVTQSRTALALLVARSPESIAVRGGSLNAISVPRVTPGLPSELIAQRPDIREAEAQLAAANANVENARLQFLPSITLTGDAGYQSAVLRTLLRPESAIYSAAAGLTQPIFEGGRLLGNLDLQKGRQDELLNLYRKSVISGFVDVENALDSIRQNGLRERLQRDVVVASRRAFDIAEQRLNGGTIDLVTVLQTQQTLFTAQDTLVQARLANLQAVISLYQALGGGWLPKPVVADAR